MDMICNLIFLIAIVGAVIWIIAAISKNQRARAQQVEFEKNYRPTYRGELGSSGLSPRDVGAHSVNCECGICLYNHDPDNSLTCRCAMCEGYRTGNPVNEWHR